MNPTSPTSAMSQGATFMRPGAMAAVPAPGFPIDVTFPGENEPDQVDAWISAYAEPFYIRA